MPLAVPTGLQYGFNVWGKHFAVHVDAVLDCYHAVIPNAAPAFTVDVATSTAFC